MSPERPRRRALLAGLTACALAGPARSAEAQGPIIVYRNAPIDLAGVRAGDWRTFLLDGEAVFARHRTAAEIVESRAASWTDLPDPAPDAARSSVEGQWVVVSGLCTHAGCVVLGGVGAFGGWACPCHGSLYDTAGRVRRGPARRNLPLIPHRIDGAALILLG